MSEANAQAVPENEEEQLNKAIEELRGVLREQCLLEHQGSAAGATSVPHPLAAPPPQNPR